MSDGYPQVSDSFPQPPPYPQAVDARPQETGVPPQVSGESLIPLPADRPDVAAHYGLTPPDISSLSTANPGDQFPPHLVWPPLRPTAGNTVYKGLPQPETPDEAGKHTVTAMPQAELRGVRQQDDVSWVRRVLFACLAMALILALGMYLAD